MDSIFDFLREVKERQIMHLSKRSIHCLKSYIDGWIGRNPEDIQDMELWGEFGEWVAAKYNVRSSQGLIKIIEFWSYDEASALDSFFEHMDEFLELKDKKG
jgi:hypothetical protein